MQTYLVAAALVAILVGIIHSVLGEMLVFQKLRKSTLVPGQPAPPLQARNIRILWATWHLGSAFGFGFAAILLSLANRGPAPDPAIIWAIVVSFVLGAGLVLIATRGRHPGWVGLLVVAVLAYLGGTA